MTSLDPKNIHNIVVTGHAKCGKTSLVDAILYLSKVNSRIGKVDDGSSLSDYSQDEIARKTSINSTIFNIDYKGKRVYLIDSPGYFDFIGETISALNTVDSAIVVIDTQERIGVGTEKFWEILDGRNLPRMIFISKIDKENSNVDEIVKSIRDRFGTKCILLKYPITENSNLVESIAETDDNLLEKYLDEGSLSEESLKKALREATINNRLIPIVTGSGLTEDGVDRLLDMIVEYSPSPLDCPPIKCHDSGSEEELSIKPLPNDPFIGYVFKTISDPYVGQLSVFRILSGTLNSSTGFYNTTKMMKERIGDVLLLQGKEQKSTPSVTIGEIAAVAKLKETKTGDTICDERRKLICKPIKFPPPIISSSVKPKTKKDEEKISDALNKLVSEDPCFQVGWDKQTKEHIISGMGDLHLEVMITRLRERFSVDVELGTPKVAYKETIRNASSVQGKYKRQSGGRGQYGNVWLKIEPLERGSGFKFEETVVGGAIPRNYFPAVEKGVKQATEEGVLAGYPITDIKATLYDGSYHEVDSSDLAFQIAGSMALKKGVEEANPVLLEPIMEVEVVVPEESMGDITGNLSSHRGRVTGMDIKGNMQIIKAMVPQAEMLRYANDLKSLTGGRGMYTMAFSHYEEVPKKISDTIIAQSKKEKES